MEVEKLVDNGKTQNESQTQKIPLLAQLVYGSYSENRSRPILSHDHCVGSPCQKCKDCSGLDLHFWRKICKNCSCKFEDHDIKVNEIVHETVVYNLLNMTDDISTIELDSDDEELKKHPILKDFCKRKESVTDTKSSRLLPPPVAKKPSSDGTRKIIGQTSTLDGSDEDRKDYEEKTEDQVNNQQSEKRKQAQTLLRQIPIQDFDPIYCHELDGFEKNELRCFRFLVQEEAIGKAITKLNNNKSIDCEHCKQPIAFKEPYKHVERLPSKQWHTDCFKCSKCLNQLAANIYFVHEDNIYCGRHYAENLKNRCAACDELIFSEKYTNAEYRNWHTKHFCCYKCDTSLANKYYVVVENQPYCVPCYNNTVADRCNACLKPIEAGTERVNFKTFNWHVNPKCFACTECHKGLIDNPFIPLGDKMFCSQLCVGVYTI